MSQLLVNWKFVFKIIQLILELLPSILATILKLNNQPINSDVENENES